MLARIVNQILSRLGVALIRKDTLDRLVSHPQSECQAGELKLLLKSLADEADLKFKELLRRQISTKWGIIDAAARHLATSASLTCPLCDYRGESGKFSTFETSCIFGGGELLRHQCPECDLVLKKCLLFRRPSYRETTNGITKCSPKAIQPRRSSELSMR